MPKYSCRGYSRSFQSMAWWSCTGAQRTCCEALHHCQELRQQVATFPQLDRGNGSPQFWGRVWLALRLGGSPTTWSAPVWLDGLGLGFWECSCCKQPIREEKRKQLSPSFCLALVMLDNEHFGNCFWFHSGQACRGTEELIQYLGVDNEANRALKIYIFFVKTFLCCIWGTQMAPVL